MFLKEKIPYLRNQYGFKLMELIIAVIIFSILAAMINAQLFKTKMRASVNMAKSNMKMLWGAERLFFQVNGSYYPFSGTVADVGVINKDLKTDLVPTDEWSYQLNGNSVTYSAIATLAAGWWKDPIQLEVSHANGNITCNGAGCPAAGF